MVVVWSETAQIEQSKRKLINERSKMWKKYCANSYGILKTTSSRTKQTNVMNNTVGSAGVLTLSW